MYFVPETDLQVVDDVSHSWRCLLFIDLTGLMSESPKHLRAKVIFVHCGGKKWGYYHNAFGEPGVRIADECLLWRPLKEL